MRRRPLSRSREVGRVHDEPIPHLDQLVEDRVAERRVARPPDVGREVVDEERRDDARQVLGRLAPNGEHDLLVADAVAAAHRVVAVRADARVDLRAGRSVLWHEHDRAGGVVHPEADQRVDDPVGGGLVDDGHDQVQDRRARVRQPLLGHQRIAAVVEALRHVPQRGEVAGDGLARSCPARPTSAWPGSPPPRSA